MSMQTDIVYGFGFNIPKHNAECFKNFILKHATTIEENYTGDDDLLKLLETARNKKDFSFDYDDLFDEFFIMDDYTGATNPYIAVSKVINWEENIMVSYLPADEDNESAIVFEKTYPWLLNEKEKSLTLDQLKDILFKYLCELTPTAKESDIDFIQNEYWS